MAKPLRAVALLRRSNLGFSLVSFACTSIGEVGDDTDPLIAEERSCESAQTELSRTCFFPNGADIDDDAIAERPTITDIAEVAEALNGGFYLGKMDAADATEHVGFVLEDNDTCRVSCLTQCNVTLYSLCVSSPSSSEEGGPQGCLFCGPATREECQSFLDACQ